ncbi:MAG: hypothetical protein EOP04_32290 [Proteobacteria bacterium]|nr:MAG: hypothetical protein EOP04_32290 [Pseudomonadota bacterium]
MSYVSDIISGRRSLTMLRAIQFADAYKLPSTDRERLTWFALAESENEEVKSFFQKKLRLQLEDISALVPSPVEHRIYNAMVAVCAFLKVRRKRMSKDQILAELDLPYLNDAIVDEVLQEIEFNGYLTYDAEGNLIDSKTKFTFDNLSAVDGRNFVTIEMFKDTTESFLHFINHPKVPSTYHTGILHLRRDQVMPILLQLTQLRNWMSELSSENDRTAKAGNNNELLQFNIQIYSVVRD